MKKAMTTAVLVVLIVTLAGLIVMMYGLKTWSDITKDVTSKEVCKQSVQLKATTKLSITPETEFVDIPLRCSTDYKFIKSKKDLENVKKLIANDMYDCWDQFGKGEIDFLFHRDFSGETYCFLCSKIVGTDPALKDMEITGLGDYLLKEKPLGSGMTYAEFLYPKTFDKTNLNEYNKLDLSNPIYVVYLINRGSRFDFLGSTKLQEVGIAIGAPLAGCIVSGGLALMGGITAPFAPLFCKVGAAGAGFLLIGEAAYNPSTDFTAQLLVTNSDGIIKRCQSK